jgi:glycosyltransferase involved in cell wall biosynthesis
MQREAPDLIHANSFDLSRSFSLAAGSLGIPYISHVRFPVTPEGARWILRGLPRPAAFIFNSQAMQDRLWPYIHKLAPRSHPYVLHNAVDVSQFAPSPWPETDLLRVGIVANFAPFKRHEDFLRMAREILQTRTDVEFLVIGDDTEGRGRDLVLKQLARDLGIQDQVRFLGHRADIPELMRSLHLLVVPSRFEPFGRVVIEAMACGRPVVASRDGGIPEIIEHGRTGFLAEVGDYAGFARLALDVLQDRARWEAVSQAASDEVRRRFSIATHTSRTLEIYRDVIEQTRGTG